MRRLIGLMVVLAAGPALAVAPAPLASDRSRYNACLALVKADPARAVANAQAWRIEGGGVAARHCLALAHVRQQDYAAALTSFEGAAIASEAAGDGQAVALWSQAADAALLAGQAEPAVRFLDRALGGAAGISLSPRAAASLRVTRAEALVDLKREGEAAADLAAAVAGDPEVANGWLLQATLARRMGDLKLAEAAILEAGRRAPDDAGVLREAGNIAAAQGKDDLAKAAWDAAKED